MTNIYPSTKKSFGHLLGTLVLSLSLILSLHTSAQVSVTSSAGVPPLTRPYTSLSNAFSAINSGIHQGTITVDINANTSEGAGATLNGSGIGSANYSAVLIRPTAPNITVTGSSTTATIKLNGADDVTIDGIIGATRQLTVVNTNPSLSDLSSVIWLACASATDAAKNNSIKNTIIRGAGYNTTFFGIIQSGISPGSIAETANENNIYENNVIIAAESGIALVGPVGNESGTIIRGNTIGSLTAADNLRYRGIFVAQQQGVIIENNEILGIVGQASQGFTYAVSMRGISVEGSISGGIIQKNSIHDLSMNTIWGVSGIYLASSTGTSGLTVANNFIWGLFANGWPGQDDDDNGFGIAIDAGGGYNIWYNSINMSINQTATNGYSAALWIDDNGSGVIAGLNVRNNIFANTLTNSNRYAVLCRNSASVFSVINYNDYYSTGSIGILVAAAQVTLANWRAATGQDLNSVDVNPSFFSATNLHLFFNSPLDGLATPIAGITQDIDDDPRNASAPDIGADEFTPPDCSGQNGGTATASSLNVCATGSVTLSSTGYSFGFGIGYQWQIGTSATGPWTDITGATNPASSNSGTIGGTRWFRLRVTCSFTGGTGLSNVLQVNVNNPSPTSTTPGTRCGIGTVNLAAAGSNLLWYSAATGGVPIGSGTNFITPSITATTPFYVAAVFEDAPVNGGKPSTNGVDGTNPNGGIEFRANSSFTLNSVLMYPTGAGTNTINIYSGFTTTGTPLFTQNVTFTGAAPLGVTVTFNGATGWVLDPGNYTIYMSTSGAPCLRDYSTAAVPPIAYPYNIGSACTLLDGTLPGYYYFFYNWNISPRCEGVRVPVTANVTTPPAITTSPGAATICQGSNVNLNVTSGNTGYTYQWNPGNLSGAAQTVTPSGNITYTVLATDASGGPNNGCVTQGSVNVVVNPAPTTLTVTPSTGNICISPSTPPYQITTIAASGGILVNKTIMSERFETFPTPQFTASGGMTATSNSIYYSEGTKSVRLENNTASVPGAVYDLATGINLNGFTNPVLSFYHICALEKNYDFGHVEYSINGGATYLAFPATAYTSLGGTGVLSNGGGVSFDSRSYPDWNTLFTGSFGPPGPPIGAGPGGSLWKKEQIDLGAYTGSTNFKVRFRYSTDINTWYYGWLLDSIRISGTTQAPVSWTTSGPTLYTNPAATTPYVAGSAAMNVYIRPTAPGPFVITATADGGSCNKTAVANLNVATVVVKTTISSDIGTSVCAGNSVTITATVINVGSNTLYEWYKDPAGPAPATLVSSVSNINTYVPPLPINTGDAFYVRITTNAGTCATYDPTTRLSDTLTFTVNPNPVVSITGPTSVCTGTPPITLTANASIAAGSISTYEWFLDGVSQGAPSPSNTFSTSTAGTYTVVASSDAVPACATTSANFIVTTPIYTINASSSANGTISPSGVVSVNCGDDQTFNIVPNAGYSICSVIVNGSSVGTPSSYTFPNVTSNGQTIAVVFCIVGCSNAPTANAGPSVTRCSNVSHTLAGSLGGSATTGTWSGGSGTFTPNNTTLNAVYTPSATEIAAGTVTLTLTSNNPTGAPCLPSVSSMTITIKEAPNVSISGAPGFCPASSTTLTANGTISLPLPVTYAWVFNGGTGLGTLSTQTSTLGAGNYRVTASANGCTDTASVNVQAFTNPSVTITGSNVICAGVPTTISASVVAGSGTINALTGFVWRLNGTPIPGETGSTLNVTVAGNYDVRVTDDNGCSSSVSPTFSLAIDNSPLNGIYTISSLTPASCTNYQSFATAITALNTRSISGNVTFNVDAGLVETVPFKGLVLGSTTLNNATSPSGPNYSIVFIKATTGANPLLVAYAGGTATPAGVEPDGIWKLRGVDNVEINSIDLVDNNPSGNAMMEFGFGLFKSSASDGAQKNKIQNCKITLNRLNNASSTIVEGSTGIIMLNAIDNGVTSPFTPSSFAGTNSNNQFYGNIIQNTNDAFGFIGYSAGAAPIPTPASLTDVNNEIGGATGISGNVILNFGGGGTGPCAAIRVTNQWNSLISYNIINNDTLGAGVAHSGAIRGIQTVQSPGANFNISNNNINLKAVSATLGCTGIENGAGALVSPPVSNLVQISNNVVKGTHVNATTGTFSGIVNTGSGTAATVNMNGNTVQNCTHTGTGTWSGIQNQSATSLNVSFSNNVLRNNNLVSTGTFNAIATGSVAGGNLNMSGNIISGNLKASSATVNWLTAGSAGTASINNNRIINNEVTAGAANVTVNCVSIGSSVYTFNGNLLSNNRITGLSGAITGSLTGFVVSGSLTSETILNDTIRRLYITGTSGGTHVIRGIWTSTATGSNKNIGFNVIDSLYTNSASTATIYGINSGTGNTINIYNNRINNIFPGAGAASVACGISHSPGGATINISNNMVGLDLSLAFSPAANGVMSGSNALRGIEFTSGTTANISYNSVRLGGTGAAGFGSSGISIAGSVNATLRNNIIDNRSIPVGAGLAVAFRRTTAGTYNTASNNNDFYSGVPSATRLLYFDGVVSYQTLATYKAGVTPRESASISVAPAFLSVVNPIDLHLDPANSCDFDGAGIPIPSDTIDFDNTIRDATNPDIGADEFLGTGGGSPVWKGVNTNWEDPLNWCGSVPTVTTNVIIPSGRSFYPVITTATPVANSININTGGLITIDNGGTLSTRGAWLIDGTLTNNGIIALNGFTAQVFPGSGTGSITAMTSLTVSNPAGATLNKPLTILGVLKPKAGTITVADNITLHSDASGTAQVDTVQGSIAYAGIGKFTVERFISSFTKKGWRFLSTPITGTQTINQAWQEGQAPGANIGTGFGTWIVGPGGTPVGYDIANTIPSLKTFNPTGNNWVAVPGTLGPITRTDGYMLFIRGDRSSNLFTSPNSATTLRMSGPIKTGAAGPFSTSVANQFISVGNPYPSAVKFSATARTALQDVYYLWDPRIGTYGGYVTIVGPAYIPPAASPSYGSGNNNIESGQAFFVVANGTAGTHSISFNENSKVSGSNQVARTSVNIKSLSTELYQNENGQPHIMDFNSVEFDFAFDNRVDDLDAPKMTNFGENVGIRRGDKVLSVERHAEISLHDTIYYELGQLRQQDYSFTLRPENLSEPGLTAYFKDSYLNTTTSVDLATVTHLNFTVNADPASSAANRFRLVFRQLGPVPVKFSSIDAELRDKNSMVAWTVQDEANVHHYNVEHSLDGRIFNKVAEVRATGSGGYNWLHTATVIGHNFYRVRSVDNGSAERLSGIARVIRDTAPTLISLHPNPVASDGVTKLTINNDTQTDYTFQIINDKGQAFQTQNVNHPGGNIVYEIVFNQGWARGTYFVKVFEGRKVKTTLKVVY